MILKAHMNKAQQSSTQQSNSEKKYVKICGLQSVEVLKSMIQLPIDYIGFVFATSKRQVNRDQAAMLIKTLHQWQNDTVPQSVGVFVNPTLDELKDIVEVAPLDVIQLHGQESPELCRQIQEQLQKQVFKVISLTNTAQQQSVEQQLLPYQGVVDAFLLDTYDPLYGGGSGKTFAWDQIEPYHQWTVIHDIPLLVAGGLTPDNVSSLLHHHSLEGVDVSSGVETDGIKDITKITTFVERVKA